MNRRAVRRLCRDWQQIINEKAHLGVELSHEMDRRVLKAQKAGKRESHYMLFVAFHKDIKRCMNGTISPDKALQQLDEHVAKWLANDPEYLGDPPLPVARGPV